MKNKSGLLLSTLLCLVPVAIGLIWWNQMPDQIPIHFDAAGEANNYASKPVAVFGLPLLMAALNVLARFKLDYTPGGEARPAALRLLTYWLIPVLSVLLLPMSFLLSMGISVSIHRVAFLLVGIIVIIFGNYLPKCRRNYTMGIRLPWTLNSEENWNRTHRFAALVWMICGLVMIVGGFLGFAWVNLGAIALMVLIPAGYSFILYQKGI